MADSVMSKHYEIKYRHSDYTWPTEAHVKQVTFDDTYMHLHMEDGRIVYVPLSWIPTLFNATPADREKVVIGEDGQTLHWSPTDGPINEDLVVASFMRYDEPEL